MWMRMKMVRYLAASGLGAAGVVGATLLLVPSYGLIGAAWAQAVGFLLLNLVLIYIGRPLMQINYSPMFLLVLTLLVSAVLQIFAGYVQCWGLGWRILLALAFGAAAGLWLKNELRELWLAQAARSKKGLP
jgi:O-antigen/teichoic acid export membrane protein